MTHMDYALTALTIWREARGETSEGQYAVACVIRNRVLKNHSTFYGECVKPWAFSSITAKGDAQLGLYPSVLDGKWASIQEVAAQVIDGKAPDLTGGATLYWNPLGIHSSHTFQTKAGETVAFPDSWNPAVVTETAHIGAHIFLEEK